MINLYYFQENVQKQLNHQFNNNKPFKYVVMENFLEEEYANIMYENFPSMEDMNVKRKSINENKREEYRMERFHPVFRQIQTILNEQRTYDMISNITGIQGLISIDNALGSGIHQSGPGSFVDIHIDVNMNPEKNLQRRVNLLIYLNKYWKEEYGGGLELWDKDVKHMGACILPNFNRAVLMETTDESYHGFSRVKIPEQETRKSFYCYYYTPISGDFVYRDSRFKTRPDEPISKKLITEIKETLKITIKRILKKLGVKSLDFQDKNKKIF